MTKRQETCNERIDAHMTARFADLKVLYRPYGCDADELVAFCEDEGIEIPDDTNREDNDEIRDAVEDIVRDRVCEYGLSFDYVAPHTFEDQAEGYWRYQFSWGGPSDELRLYGDHEAGHQGLNSAEYWFLDWFDGAHRNTSGDDMETVDAIWADFDSMDMLRSTYDDAMHEHA